MPRIKDIPKVDLSRESLVEKERSSFYQALKHRKTLDCIEDTFQMGLLDRFETEEPSHNKPDFTFIDLFAGFPCQSFSRRGHRKGFEDTRRTLFFEVARIIKHRNPSYILLENVQNLVTHDSGKTFETICNTLDELGYAINASPLILSPDDFGIPAIRKVLIKKINLC